MLGQQAKGCAPPVVAAERSDHLVAKVELLAVAASEHVHDSAHVMSASRDDHHHRVAAVVVVSAVLVAHRSPPTFHRSGSCGTITSVSPFFDARQISRVTPSTVTT